MLDARMRLVRHLRSSGVKDERVLDAIARVPRHEFVPAELADEAYDDRALPIGEGQTISQPYVVARMTELLDVRDAHHVLEVGGGSGYQAAVLALLARDVVTVERHAPLAASAAQRLAALGYTNVRVVEADASAGYEPEAPYDRILVAAAAPDVERLAAQLVPDGLIVAPVGDLDAQELVVRHADGRVERRGPVRFVPLIGRAGFRER